MDELERRQDHHARIPLQYGPGLKTIWPSDELAAYEARAWAAIDHARGAKTHEQLRRSADAEYEMFLIARQRVQPNEQYHLSALHAEVQRMQERSRAILEAYSRSYPEPELPRILTLDDQRRSYAQELFDAYNRSRIGQSVSPSVESKPHGDGADARRATLAPSPLRRLAQGMARPNGWTGGGKFPGYPDGARS